MSRYDNIRPAKRIKHEHSEAGNSKLTNGINTLLNASTGLGNGERFKATLSNDKIKNKRNVMVDESRTVVQVNGDAEMKDGPADVVEISSDEESSVVSSEEDTSDNESSHERDRVDDKRRIEEARTYVNGDLPEDESADEPENTKKEKKRKIADDVDEEDIENAHNTATKPNKEDEEPSNNEEPSFGELLQAQAPSESIDVASAFPDEHGQEGWGKSFPGRLKTTETKQSPHKGPITANSLGTVLTQALRSNDNDLLESCLSLNDLAGVRATIERLQSRFATVLLLRLAERLHRRPGRAGNLMVWVQWTLVAHGGYLATQPTAMAQLKILRRVMRERANGLQPLLRLKGKLDMLAAQVELRRKMRNARPDREDDKDDDDDEGVIYVEGAPGNDAGFNDDVIIDEDADNIGDGRRKKRRDKKTAHSQERKKEEQATATLQSSSDSEDMPTTAANGLNSNGDNIDDSLEGSGGEDDEDEDPSSEDENLIDDEAEETDRDTGDDELSEGSDLDGFVVGDDEDEGEDLDEIDDYDEDDVGDEEDDVDGDDDVNEKNGLEEGDDDAAAAAMELNANGDSDAMDAGEIEDDEVRVVDKMDFESHQRKSAAGDTKPRRRLVSGKTRK